MDDTDMFERIILADFISRRSLTMDIEVDSIQILNQVQCNYARLYSDDSQCVQRINK